MLSMYEDFAGLDNMGATKADVDAAAAALNAAAATGDAAKIDAASKALAFAVDSYNKSVPTVASQAPWYKNTKTLALIGVGVLAFFFLAKKRR